MQVVLIQYVNRGKILKTNDKKKIENEIIAVSLLKSFYTISDF